MAAAVVGAAVDEPQSADAATGDSVELDAVDVSGKVRDGYGQYVGEVIATFGIGLILGYPQLITIVGDYTSQNDRGKGMGLNGMVSGLASLVMFGMFGAIMKKGGVLAGFDACLLMAAVGAVLTAVFMKDRMPEKPAALISSICSLKPVQMIMGRPGLIARSLRESSTPVMPGIVISVMTRSNPPASASSSFKPSNPFEAVEI